MNLPRARLVATIVVFATLVAMPWLLARYQLSVLVDLLIFGLFAMSLDLIMGYAGLISFGHAAYFGIGAYTSALVLLHFGPPVPVALVAGAVVSGAIAAPIGWLSTRATGIYFAMLTLAFAQLLYTVAFKWRGMTGGSDGLAGVPRTSLFWGIPPDRSATTFYFLVVICLLLSWLACWAITRSPFGRAIRGLHQNENRFISLGRDSRPFKLIIFIAAAFFGGLAGALHAPFRGFASPEAMSWLASGQVIMMVVMGGTGTLIGPVIGAMLFILIEEVLSSYTEHWMLFAGLIFVLIVIAMPGGVAGIARSLFERRS
jgi:branched-chain amino acid transport system permease protein